MANDLAAAKLNNVGWIDSLSEMYSSGKFHGPSVSQKPSPGPKVELGLFRLAR
jgi:hypothetical protein